MTTKSVSCLGADAEKWCHEIDGDYQFQGYVLPLLREKVYSILYPSGRTGGSARGSALALSRRASPASRQGKRYALPRLKPGEARPPAPDEEVETNEVFEFLSVLQFRHTEEITRYHGATHGGFPALSPALAIKLE